MLDDSIQSAYRRAVEGEPVTPTETPFESVTRAPTFDTDELSLDIVVDVVASRARENDVDAPTLRDERTERRYQDESDATMARAEARLAWSRVRALEEALAATRSAAAEHTTALHRLQAERERSDHASRTAETAHDMLRTDLARVTVENARLREAARRAEVEQEDAAVVRRGLADDLRSWRRRALQAEAIAVETNLAISGDDDAAWREAGALAQRLARAEERAAELADEAEAARRERDQTEATLAALAEAVEGLDRSDDVWRQAAAVGERLAAERDEATAALAAAERVHARLVWERDEAHRALEQATTRHGETVETMRRQLQRLRASVRAARRRTRPAGARKGRQRHGAVRPRSSAR